MQRPVLPHIGPVNLFLCVAVLCLSVILSPAANPQPNRDFLLGWYAMGPAQTNGSATGHSGQTLIPVLKHSGSYFSVCRGMEVLLRPCTNGLEWAVLPSSMEGTRITRDPETGGIFITIQDAQAAAINDDSNYGVPQPLRKVPVPGPFQPLSQPRPRVLDFSGSYRALYIPQIRYDVVSTNGAQQLRGYIYLDGQWTAEGTAAEAPLVLHREKGRLAVSANASNLTITLGYNLDLRRYELAFSSKQGSSSMCMPLVRVSSTDQKAPPPEVRIGIPSWH